VEIAATPEFFFFGRRPRRRNSRANPCAILTHAIQGSEHFNARFILIPERGSTPFLTEY